MQIFNVEQGSEEWLNMRKGVITGTRLSSVMGTPAARKTLIYELIAEVIAPTPEGFKSKAMERGNIIEEIVKIDYPEVEEVGFIKKYDWLGISPDGLIKTDGKYTKAIEIKSPEPKAFVKYKLTGGIPKEYIDQVVHYFIVIDDLQELDFIIYNPEIYDPEYRKMTIHITRGQLQESIEKAKEYISSFREEWMNTLEDFIKK